MLAAVCAEKGCSIFFNDKFIQGLKSQNDNGNVSAQRLLEIILSLNKFAYVELNVINVNQLGIINQQEIIPLNVHLENNNYIAMACLPLIVTGQGELPVQIVNIFEQLLPYINLVLKAMIPNLQIELEKRNESEDKNGNKTVNVEVYSNRGNKRFLMRYESEGIKRIISILSSLISVYNDVSGCVVIDELDSGIFEYLLGELLGVLKEGMKGQLIFTSHNLHILEKLDSKNIICTTTNPDDRYIRLTGMESNHNHRDFYIRSLAIGGQKETLYDDKDLISLGYAFRKAGRMAEKHTVSDNENNVADSQ